MMSLCSDAVSDYSQTLRFALFFAESSSVACGSSRLTEIIFPTDVCQNNFSLHLHSPISLVWNWAYTGTVWATSVNTNNAIPPSIRWNVSDSMFGKRMKRNKINMFLITVSQAELFKFQISQTSGPNPKDIRFTATENREEEKKNPTNRHMGITGLQSM